MAITYTQALGQVRLLISDVDEAHLVLDDDMITGFLARYGVVGTGPVTPRGPINRAAADALDAIATSETLTLKYIRTGDGLTTDGSKVGDSIRKQAASLRAQADRDDKIEGTDGGFFASVEFRPYGPAGVEATENPA